MPRLTPAAKSRGGNEGGLGLTPKTAANTTPGPAPATANTAASHVATHPPQVEGAAATKDEKTSYDIQDIMKMIQTSALPESVMLSIGGSPVVDFTQIDHRVGCTLEEPGAIEAAEIFAVKSHAKKKLKMGTHPTKWCSHAPGAG